MLMFERSKSESLRDVSVTRIGDALSYGFPWTDFVNFSLPIDDYAKDGGPGAL